MSVATPAPVEPAAPAESPARPAGGSVRPLSAWWVLIAGVIGFAASATLTIEKIEMLKNPGYVPTCSINPVLSCGSVMVTHQASIFGFPNPLMGIAGFAVVIVTGVLAVTRVRLPQWYWVGMLIGTVLAAVFVHWLIYQTLYVIGALCPYCMVVPLAEHAARSAAVATDLPLTASTTSPDFRPAFAAGLPGAGSRPPAGHGRRPWCACCRASACCSVPKASSPSGR